MFFSDDLLSSKKGSFGIIWLAATLGPKTKRITRKQLTTVDLNRTCELIAEPPEPLALRLSGCLLVGVARVYNQNYDLFYTDVTKFHSDLRRMVLTDFGAATGVGGQPVGLDLTGDGKAKIDQITFGGEDASWLSGLNADFLNMHWSHPEHVSRKRAASTQLSTLPSQHSQKSLPEEDDGEEEGSSDEDDTDEELESEVGRTGKRRKTRTTSPGGTTKRTKVSYIDHRPTSQSSHQGDEPFLIDDLELFPDGLFDIDPPGGNSSFTDPADQGQDQPEVNYDDPIPNGRGSLSRHGSQDINGVQGDEDQQHQDNAEPEPQGDGEEAQPEKRKKKAKKARKVKFDDDLEIEYDALGNASYAENMTFERSEARAKERARTVEDRATALVDGAGDWVNFYDPEMKELFVTCSRAGKFQWEQDGAVAGAKYHEKPVDALEHHPFEQEVTEDIPGPNVTTDPSAPYIDPYEDFDISVNMNDDIEVPRQRNSQSQRSQLESQTQLPWADQAFDSDEFDGLDAASFTPGSRLSMMTPLERKIRLSSGKSSLIQSRRNRERSPSVPGGNQNGQQLVSDENAQDFDLGDDPFDPRNLPQSQLRGGLPEAFQPHMLASLETQCRDFMAFTERKMRREAKTEIDFEEMVEPGSTKRVAALAFYNCLTLATKRILAVTQEVPWNTITFQFKIDA